MFRSQIRRRRRSREEPGENKAVERCNAQPVDTAKEPPGPEFGGLGDASAGAVYRGELPCQPRIAGQAHLSMQAQQSPGDNGLDAPEVDWVSDTEAHRVAPSAAQTGTADQLIENPTDPPETLAGIPTLVTANRQHGGKHFSRDRQNWSPSARL